MVLYSYSSLWEEVELMLSDISAVLVTTGTSLLIGWVVLTLAGLVSRHLFTERLIRGLLGLLGLASSGTIIHGWSIGGLYEPAMVLVVTIFLTIMVSYIFIFTALLLDAEDDGGHDGEEYELPLPNLDHDSEEEEYQLAA